jgi:hypothetical protein
MAPGMQLPFGRYWKKIGVSRTRFAQKIFSNANLSSIPHHLAAPGTDDFSACGTGHIPFGDNNADILNIKKDIIRHSHISHQLLPVLVGFLRRIKGGLVARGFRRYNANRLIRFKIHKGGGVDAVVPKFHRPLSELASGNAADRIRGASIYFDKYHYLLSPIIGMWIRYADETTPQHRHSNPDHLPRAQMAVRCNRFFQQLLEWFHSFLHSHMRLAKNADRFYKI